MHGYGQFCPIAKAAEVFCERWTAIVIRNIAAGAHRFSDIHRGAPHMSATLLSQRLKTLEAEGIVARQHAETGKHWRYVLTEAGQDFLPLITGLDDWGRRWTRRALEEGEIDLGLLIWGLEHALDARAFGAGQTVVRLEFADQPAHRARYWFVCEEGAMELCVSDPGPETDLYLRVTLADMIHLYRGDVALEQALADGRLDVHGPVPLTDALARFLNLPPLRAVRRRRAC